MPLNIDTNHTSLETHPLMGYLSKLSSNPIKIDDFRNISKQFNFQNVQLDLNYHTIIVVAQTIVPQGNYDKKELNVTGYQMTDDDLRIAKRIINKSNAVMCFEIPKDRLSTDIDKWSNIKWYKVIDMVSYEFIDVNFEKISEYLNTLMSLSILNEIKNASYHVDDFKNYANIMSELPLLGKAIKQHYPNHKMQDIMPKCILIFLHIALISEPSSFSITDEKEHQEYLEAMKNIPLYQFATAC